MATRTYPRLILTSGQTYTQPSGDTIIILEYVSGDWDGAIFASDTPGTPFMLNVPIAGISVVGCTFTDCDASGGGEIIAVSGGVDGGGNTNILFGGGGVGILFAIYEDDRED
jgi:hypothetical protein